MGEGARHADGAAEDVGMLPDRVERDDAAERRAPDRAVPAVPAHADSARSTSARPPRPATGRTLVTRLRVLRHPVARIDPEDDEVLHGVHGAKDVAGLVDLPVVVPGRPPRGRRGSGRPACRRREVAQRVLVVPGRQVAANPVVAPEELRRKLHQRGESPRFGLKKYGYETRSSFSVMSTSLLGPRPSSWLRSRRGRA